MSNVVQNSSFRLPISHPEFQYRPSPNPYWKKIQSFEDLIYSDQSTEKYSGEWRSRFKQRQGIPQNVPLHVEIGCNTGHVILANANRNLDSLWIGIDWKFKPIYRAAEKADQFRLKNPDFGNVLFFRAHAERISYMFGPSEVDSVSLFFPDPWPKRCQQKNRFLNMKQLEKIHQIVKPGGIFHIKTDHSGYFEEMVQAIGSVSHLWEVVELTRDLHKGHPYPDRLDYPEVTLFEKLFIKDGIPIKRVNLRAIK